jgi:hypothetical protein
MVRVVNQNAMPAHACSAKLFEGETFGVVNSYAGTGILRCTKKILIAMENKGGKKPGPKDRSYVNKSQEHEVKHEPKRKTPAKKFGGK